MDGGGQLAAARENNEPLIFSFWHNRSFLAFHVFERELWRRGYAVLVLASQSRDGELVARLARQLGLSVVRGSASRGGREAVRAIYRAVRKGGASPVMVPDGPRGPLYHFKVGVAILAQISEAPILPIGMAARSFFTLKSWDRLIVPRPFSRIVAVVGEPRRVPRGLAPEELEEARLGLESRLNELTRQAEECLE